MCFSPLSFLLHFAASVYVYIDLGDIKEHGLHNALMS